MKGNEYTKNTWLIHGLGRTNKWDFSHHVVPPLSSSTAYRLESVERGARGFSKFGQITQDPDEPPVYIYDRLDEPTRSLLESNLAILEGGNSCLTFASGMAAISAALGSILSPGDEVLAHTLLYGCTHSLFTNWYPRLGYNVQRVDCTNTDNIWNGITEKTRIVYFESPINPTLDMINIKSMCALAAKANESRTKEKQILVIVDNTFATPFCQRPIEYGADLVIESLTKNLGGFGTELGGAVICPGALRKDLLLYRKDFGGILSSKSAWAIMVYGLPTLPLRMKRQQYTAQRVATFLEGLDEIIDVRYPGLKSFPYRQLAECQMRDFDNDFAPGSMIYFVLDRKLIDPIVFADSIAANAYSVTLAVSLGHVKTLLELPGYMTHSAYGDSLPDELRFGIRLSIGLESPKDIIKDLKNAIHAARRSSSQSVGMTSGISHGKP